MNAKSPTENTAPGSPCSGTCTGDNWRVVTCNEACSRFFAANSHKRTKTRTVEGTSLFALFRAADYARVRERVQSCSQFGFAKFYSTTHAIALAWAKGRNGGHNFIFYEIPDDRYAVEPKAYELLGRELQEIIDSMHDGIWVIDGQGQTVHVNRAMKRIAGIEPSEMIGRHVTQPIMEGKFSSSITLMALEQKKVVTMFDDYACGTRCLNTSTPIFDDQGNIWRVVASIRDMTELESLQKRLVEAEMEAYSYKGQLAGIRQDSAPGFIAGSKKMRQCLHMLEKAAKAPSGILLLGETGTGKTLAASVIHQKSPRAAMPFISVNCAAIPQSLIESELFGYEKGAFTGAGQSGKKGFFELADKGTLLLDEIGELPPAMQVKLLHVLDNQTFHKIGSEKSIKVDVRIVAATNRPLEQLVSNGEFRADLYYRLRVLSVVIPPLREHPEDIPELAMAFLGDACKRHGTIKTFSPKVLRCLAAHHWPGNVRELRGAVEFLAAMTEGNSIRLADLPPHIINIADSGFALPDSDAEKKPDDLRSALKNLERSMIRNALAQTGSTYKAAKLLGISQSSVVRKAQQHGIGPIR